jgi:DNA polymerase epsilon subunit 2
MQMITIQSLIGCAGKRWIMGVISQLEDGNFFLEDLTAAIPIDLSQAISLNDMYFIIFLQV